MLIFVFIESGQQKKRDFNKKNVTISLPNQTESLTSIQNLLVFLKSLFGALHFPLTSQSVTGSNSATTAYVHWGANPTWTSASFTANGAIIYNTTFDGGSGTTDAVCVLAFGANYTATNGTFTVQFPAAGTSTAILRLS